MPATELHSFEPLPSRQALLQAWERLQNARHRYVEADDAALQAILLWKRHRSCGKNWVYITNSEYSNSSDWVALDYIRHRAVAAWRMRQACRKVVAKAKVEHEALSCGAASERLPTLVASILSRRVELVSVSLVGER